MNNNQSTTSTTTTTTNKQKQIKFCRSFSDEEKSTLKAINDSIISDDDDPVLLHGDDITISLEGQVRSKIRKEYIDGLFAYDTAKQREEFAAKYVGFLDVFPEVHTTFPKKVKLNEFYDAYWDKVCTLIESEDTNNYTVSEFSVNMIKKISQHLYTQSKNVKEFINNILEHAFDIYYIHTTYSDEKIASFEFISKEQYMDKNFAKDDEKYEFCLIGKITRADAVSRNKTMLETFKRYALRALLEVCVFKYKTFIDIRECMEYIHKQFFECAGLTLFH